MPSRRPPWWVYGIAVSLATYLALLLYADVFGPGTIGAALRFRAGADLEVSATQPGYPADRAGVRTGDRIALAIGQPVRTLFDWYAVSLQMETARPFPLVVERNGERRAADLNLSPHWRFWNGTSWLLFALKGFSHVLVLVLAVFLALARWNDPAARLAALFLGGLAVTNISPLANLDPHAPTLPYGAYAIWRQLPALLHVPLWVGLLTLLVSPVLPMLFFVVFPRPLFRTRRAWLWFAGPWTLLSVPVLGALVYWSAREVYDPEHVTAVFPTWLTPLVGVSVLAAIACGLGCFVTNYRRLTEPNERRRVRVIVAGAIVGTAPQAVIAMATFFASPALHAVARSPLVRAGASLLFLAFPISFVYAIARHRLFDIRVLIRRGLQYALARRVLVSIVPAAAVVLAIDLLVHGDRPLRSILAARGWIYAGVAALALAAQARRARWLDALDRRFFREHYDAHRLMRQIVDDLRSETTIERAAPRVVLQIEGALHPEFAAVLVRAPGDDLYRPVAAAPADRRPPPISAASKLVNLVCVLGKPVEVSAGESGWLGEQLPPEETAFVRDARIGLLVPIATADEGHDALLALGVKRSEEPYSREDQELLAALAGSVALVAARPASAPPTEGFSECPRCGSCYDTGSRLCSNDGATLLTVHFPRLLGQRYLVERRLGHGGMGAVYEGIDTQLDRRVALKVIREEWLGNSDAAVRFRREARAAASLSHPNVVTVHDFGLAGENRAFLVMELLRGATLRDALRGEQRLSPERSLALMRDVCAAIDAAHRRHLVHRDLKPENIFLVGDAGRERAKVLDFGIAKMITGDGQTAAATTTGGLLGTLHYMGPDQLRGLAVEPGWDLWALAVIAYEMLSGALPFDTTSAADYQRAVLDGRRAPIRTHLPAAPAALDAFFDRALAPLGRQRPGSAPVILAEFEEALGLRNSTSA